MIKKSVLRELADNFNRYFTSMNSVAPNARITVPTKEWEQLYALIESHVESEPVLADVPHRDDLVKVARVFASAYGQHEDAPEYLPRTPEAAAMFEPQGWVIAAMMQAHQEGRFHAGRAQAKKEGMDAWREALEKIAEWSSHSVKLSVDYGSNGVRDFYRNIARTALDSLDPHCKHGGSALTDEEIVHSGRVFSSNNSYEKGAWHERALRAEKELERVFQWAVCAGVPLYKLYSKERPPVQVYINVTDLECAKKDAAAEGSSVIAVALKPCEHFNTPILIASET